MLAVERFVEVCYIYGIIKLFLVKRYHSLPKIKR